MLLKLNRFLTAEEVKTLYKFPDALFDRLKTFFPVQYYGKDGIPLYLESVLDKFLREAVERFDPSKATDDELVRTSERVFRRTAGQLPNEVVRSGRVRIEGKEYGPLTAYESRLMDVLMEGVPIETGDVIEHVYGHDVDGKENALKQVRKRLVKKLIEQGCPALIESVNNHIVLRIPGA